MITIKNKEIEFTINPKGAEGVSLCDVKTGREYWWHGDPQYWGGHAPILFPAVGGHWNGCYRYEGTTYPMTKHGFVRTRQWELMEQGEDFVRFSFTVAGEDLVNYPFPSRATVVYRLEGRKLVASFEVENLGEHPMYFQMGGHPGLVLEDFDPAVPISGYLRLEGNPKSLLRAGEQGCTEAQRYAVPMNDEGLIPLSVETFANEALIFDNHQVSAAVLLRTDGSPVARVESSAPVWLFWSPQGVHAPFVCAEPWYGLCDPIGFEGDLSERPYINRLEAGQQWEGGYTVEVFS